MKLCLSINGNYKGIVAGIMIYILYMCVNSFLGKQFYQKRYLQTKRHIQAGLKINQ